MPDDARPLNELDDAVQTLQRPNVNDYFRMAPQGKNVEALLGYMYNKGLRFAPATGGDERAYLALHNALVGYSAGVQSQLTAKD